MKNVVFIWLLLLSAIVVSCKDEENFENVPGASAMSWSDTEAVTAEEGVKNYTFEAATDWTAASDQSAWCTVTNMGKAGKSVLKATIKKNDTGKERTANITIVFNGYKSVSFAIKQEAGEEPEIPADPVNAAIDEYLSAKYLWNDEYNGMKRDLTIPYASDYDNFLTRTLSQMTTNKFDLKPYAVEGGVEYRLYSYIIRTPKSSTRATNAAGGVNHPNIKKPAPINSFGIASMIIIQFTDQSGQPTGEWAFSVAAVYPGSPAEKEGLKRGSLITQIYNRTITDATWQTDYLNLLLPSEGSVMVGLSDKTSVNLYTEMIDPTPIIAHKIWEAGGKKIGYLHYMSFEAGYDDDLMAVLKEFKSAGINELILDLRYNGGGYVITSNMLSTSIAGTAADGKIYQYYRYNDTRMANVEQETDKLYDESAKLFYENFYSDEYFGVKMADYKLNLPRVFVITTSSTASASEAVINSLRGIDFDVVTIGSKSNGKNVGMEGVSLSYENYIYELTPITFQGYNAKQESVDPTGITPDIAAEDWDKEKGLTDFQMDEPMIAEAIAQITGKKPEAPATRSVLRVPFRKADVGVPEVAPIHPQGMITLPIRKDVAQ